MAALRNAAKETTGTKSFRVLVGTGKQSQQRVVETTVCLYLSDHHGNACKLFWLRHRRSPRKERGFGRGGGGISLRKGDYTFRAVLRKKIENRTYCSILQVWFELSGVRCVPLERRFKTWSAIYERPLVSSPAKGGRR